MMTMRHDFLTFIGARASIDLADVIDVTMATVAVVEDALGIILWLTDEESFHVGRGVAMGWTGVDMSTPLLPEVVPEIDANPGVFTGGGGGGVGQVWSLTHRLRTLISKWPS